MKRPSSSNEVNEADQPPKWKVKRAQPNPDIALSTSEIPAVQSLIRQNNLETKMKKRLKVFEFLNMAFCTIGLDAMEDRDMLAAEMTLLEEFVTKHRILPKNTSLAKVLYAWMEAGMIADAVHMVRKLLECREVVPNSFKTSFEERVATVSLRIIVQSADVDQKLIMEVLQLLPPTAYRRRLFSPLLEFAKEKRDSSFGLKILSIATEHDVELWDADYNILLGAVHAERDETMSGSLPQQASAAVVEATEKVLLSMAEHHPVVGADNANLVKDLLGGVMTNVDAAGQCMSCGCLLSSFDFTDADRQVLVQDILDKLIGPRIEGKSHYEPDKKVTAEEKERRSEEVESFKTLLQQSNYDAVIDGANIGYYGLSNWYTQAKEDLLRSRGVNPADVPLSERSQPPLPVDVSPKFTLIESMRKIAIREGRRPVIVLHARHLAHGPKENMDLLDLWRREKSIIPSPSFLNDDYCWLYAAIVRPNTFVISNDQMRDHHFSLLSPRFFLRWRQRHRVTYKALFHSATGGVTLVPKTPRPYAVWVQAAARAASQQRHWHVPFIAGIAVIDQATNRTTTTANDVDLGKDGDDTCTGWLCTHRPSDE